MQTRTEIDLVDHAEEKIGSPDEFRVHSSLLAVKSGRCGFQSIDAGAVGEIVGPYNGPRHPGLVMIRIEGELFLTWARDLEERTDVFYK